jgi:hypothetical protein
MIDLFSSNRFAAIINCPLPHRLMALLEVIERACWREMLSQNFGFDGIGVKRNWLKNQISFKILC